MKVLIFILLIFTVSISNAQSSNGKIEKSKNVKTTFAVKGMTCQGCVYAVKNTLTNIDGVIKSNVSLKRREAAVEYDPKKVNAKVIEKVFDGSHYKVDEKKSKNKNKKKTSKNESIIGSK